MAVRNPERLDGLITHRIWTREHEGRRRSWNHPDWCRCLRRSGRLAVRASTPDSTNRLLLAIPFFTHLPTCWIGYQRRDGLPVHPTILCPCATSSSTPDSVGFCHDGNDRRHTSPLADCLERRTLQLETRSPRNGRTSQRLRHFDRRLHHLVAPSRTCDRRDTHPWHRFLLVQSSAHMDKLRPFGKCRFRSPHDRDIFPCPHDDHGSAHRIQLPPATASTVVWLVAAGGLYPYGLNRIHPADSLWGFVLWHP